MSTEIKSADEFLAGQIACQNGKECSPGASEDFERGFAAQYQMDQAMDARSDKRGH